MDLLSKPQIDYVTDGDFENGDVRVGVRMEYKHSNKKPQRKTETILNR